MSIEGDIGDMDIWISGKIPISDVPVPLRALRLARKTAHELVHERKTNPLTIDTEILAHIHEELKRTMEGSSESTPTYFSELNGKHGYTTGGGFHHVDAYIHTPHPRVTTYIISVVNCDWIARIHKMPSNFTHYCCYLDAEEVDNQVMSCEIFTEDECSLYKNY